MFGLPPWLKIEKQNVQETQETHAQQQDNVKIPDQSYKTSTKSMKNHNLDFFPSLVQSSWFTSFPRLVYQAFVLNLLLSICA
jgi:hypothetical protein